MIAIYTRQSVDKKDSISIESQIDFCKKEIGDESYTVYTDKGFSGGNIKRPSFEEMMNNIKQGNISKIAVYKLDRISRSITDFASIISILQEHNVDFISATEKFDTSTPMGRAMVYIVMVFAQLERETIAERVKDNYYARGKKGFFMGGNCPWGFKSIKTTVEGKKASIMVADNEKIEIVKKMYEIYSNTNASLSKVQKYLNDNKIKTPGGVTWDTIKINRILRNPAYVKADADIYTYFTTKGCIISNDLAEFKGEKGCFLFGKRDKNANKYRDITDHVLTIGQHDGVVDSETWLLCQYKLDSNKQIKNSGKGKHTWLSGLVKCEKCGYSMKVVTYKDTKYFVCSGRTNYKICSGHKDTIYVNNVEDFIEIELKTIISKYDSTQIESNKIDNQEVNLLKIQLIEIEKQIENLINQMAESNDIVVSYINKKISELDNKKNNLLDEINKINIKNSKNNRSYQLSNDINEWDSFNTEKKKEVAQSLIEKILINDDEIIIEWKQY